MSRSCATCDSQNRREIEHLKSTGVGLRELARRYPSVTKDSLSRHFAGGHPIERALETTTTTIYEELAVVIRELFDTPDPSRAESVREREAI